MSSIVWLASYPKSGNTWLRIFLANLLGRGEFKLNDVLRSLDDGLGIASNRELFDEMAGLPSSELLPEEIDLLRPRVYDAIAAEYTEPLYLKVHDAWLAPGGEPLMPLEATRAAVYIVRNPLDVAVSFAFHRAANFDDTIAVMADPAFTFGRSPAGLPAQLHQRLLSWSGHVSSWLDAPGLKPHAMRYEDMVMRPFETFTAAVRFLKLADDEAAIRRAIDASRFDRLRDEEDQTGFVEKPRKAARFFREGQVGDWRSHLSPDQARRIIDDHRDVMRRLGYLDDDDRPKF
jgi:hypothetical protein